MDLRGIAHSFFGRRGGVSESIYTSLNCGPGSNDNRAHVIENRTRAMQALTDRDASLVTLYQVHGSETLAVREPWVLGRAPSADAIVTDVPGIALGILTADCAPILLADAHARVIGAAHAGWKGAVAGVIESAIKAMEQLGARREHIAAAVGPCISQASYEVGDELREALKPACVEGTRFFIPSDRERHWRFDLGGYTQAQLARGAIDNVSAIPACTYLQEAAFFSYRRATHRGEADYGRQLSTIVLL
jgi:YfiH family protein